MISSLVLCPDLFIQMSLRTSFRYSYCYALIHFLLMLVIKYLMKYCENVCLLFFFFSSRRRHTRLQGDWSSDVCSSDLVRIDRAVGLDVDDQLVEVGALLDASGLDAVGDAAHRRERGVELQAADRAALLLELETLDGGPVAAAALDLERHRQLGRLVQVRDHEVRVHDRDVVVDLDVARGDRARALLAEPELDRVARVHLDRDRLEVQQDVDDVLLDTLDAGVLVQHAVDLDLGHGAAGHRGEQHAPQRVAERVAEAALERLDHDARLARSRFRHLDGPGLEEFRGGTLHCRHPLFRVELDDQVLVDVRENLVAVRQRLERAAEFLVVDVDPVGPADLGRDRERGPDARLRLRFLAHRDHVAGGALVRRDVHRLAVHLDRLVRDELAGLGAGRREAHAVNDVVEASLEEAQQVLAGGSRAARGLRVVVAELALEHAVHAAQLLLLAQLHAVAREARAAVALDAAGRHLELALALERLDAALQEQVGALAARELALGTQVSGHRFLDLRRAASWAGGNRCAESASRRRCS